MKSLPVFFPLQSTIDEAKLSTSLRDAGLACKVKRDAKGSVKLSPESEKTCPEAIRNFVAGFDAGYFAF